MDKGVLKEGEYIRIAREWNFSAVITQECVKEELNSHVSIPNCQQEHKHESAHDHGQKQELFRIEDGSQEHIDEFHTRWLNIYNLKNTRIKDCAYNMMRFEWQEIETQRQKLNPPDTGITIQSIQIPKRHNMYIGPQWTMPKGLKVLIRQGALVIETTEVIVNSANSKLYHG